MKKLTAMLLILALLCPAAMAQTCSAFIYLGDAPRCLLYSQEGKLLAPVDMYSQLYCFDEENHFFSATLRGSDAEDPNTGMLLGADGAPLTEGKYYSFEAGYADRVIYSLYDPNTFVMLCGLMDAEGSEIIAAQYSTIAPDGEGGFIAMLNGSSRLVLLDHDGNPTFTPFILSQYPGYEDTDLLPVRTSATGPVGYVDREMNWVIEPQFADGTFFTNGYANVWQADENDNWLSGLINAQGDIVLPAKYGYIEIGDRIIATDSEWQLTEVYSTDMELLFTYAGTLNTCGEMYHAWPADGGKQLLDAEGRVLRSLSEDEGYYFAAMADPDVTIPVFTDGATQRNYLIDASGNPQGNGWWSIYPATADVLVVADGPAANDDSGYGGPEWSALRYGLARPDGSVILPPRYHELIAINALGHIYFSDSDGYGILLPDGTELLRISRYTELID